MASVVLVDMQTTLRSTGLAWWIAIAFAAGMALALAAAVNINTPAARGRIDQ